MFLSGATMGRHGGYMELHQAFTYQQGTTISISGAPWGVLGDPVDGAEELLEVLVATAEELLDVPVDAAVPHVVVDVDGAGRWGGLAGRGAQLLAAQRGIRVDLPVDLTG